MRLHGLALALPLLAACPSDPEFEPWLLEPLEPAEGFTAVVPEFEVASGQETQDCYFFQVPDLDSGNDLLMSRMLTAINPGSHHMNVFRVNTIVNLDPADGEAVDLGNGLSGTVLYGGAPGTGECWKAPNWADWPLVTNSQKSNADDPYTDWQLPADVALRFAPGEMLMLQTHYVNATSQETPFRGRVGVSFYRSTDAAPQELGSLFATQQSIRICASNPNPTYSGTCSMPAHNGIKVIAANGHFHSRGQQFDVFTWDGLTETQPPVEDRFYTSDVWDDPPMARDMDITIPNGGGVWWTCEFQWYEPSVGCEVVDARDPQMEGDCCYTFGPLVEASEHCNVFAYYYPRVDRADIFCN